MTNEQNPQTEEDPIALYCVVRESLNMSIGKCSAQVGHSVQLVIMSFWEEEKLRNELMEFGRLHADDDRLSKFSSEQWLLFHEWADHSKMTKITLSADDKEFEKVKRELPEHERFVVVDNGKTELLPGTETVIGVIPMRKSQRPKILKRLQTLK